MALAACGGPRANPSVYPCAHPWTACSPQSACEESGMPYPHCQPRSAARRCVLLWERPAWAAALALLVYSLFAAYHGALWRSHHPYFNYLADAFLHGQLYLRLTPPTVGDLVWFHGRYYLYWSPLPALLLLPFVAIFGVGFPDIPFTLAIA